MKKYIVFDFGEVIVGDENGWVSIIVEFLVFKRKVEKDKLVEIE